MKCNICEKEMKYFKEGMTCGWKCNSCGSIIVTTYDDGINMDETTYTIHILSENDTAAKNIKSASKALGCSFLEAKESLLQGREIKNLSAIQARDILIELQSSTIRFTTTPAFNHPI